MYKINMLNPHKHKNKRFALFETTVLVILTSIACLSSIPLTRPARTAVPAAFVSASATATTEAEPFSGALYEVPTKTPDTCAIITAAKAVNLREKPTEHSRVLTWLQALEQVQIIERGTWWKVIAGEWIGYVKADYIKECE